MSVVVEVQDVDLRVFLSTGEHVRVRRLERRGGELVLITTVGERVHSRNVLKFVDNDASV